MKTRDEIDEMLALEVLSDPLAREGLSDRQITIINEWLKQCNDRRGIPEWPHNKKQS